MLNIDEMKFKSKKIISISKSAKLISKFKKSNKKVGLCHGGFDLLHPGHIKHLESASRLCDCLFVSITSDRFVKYRKGNGRPIFSEKLRAYSVASLVFVDYVVISDFERATEILEKLKPSYYIKGPDFINKTTPGISAEKKKIKEVKGRIKYTKDPKLSTTDIIDYIQKNVRSKKLLLVLDRDGTLIDDVPYIGKEKYWKEQIKIKKEVVDLINHIQTKYNTFKVVISNQQGVARGYFSIKMVEKINKHIDTLLRKNGIVIDNWQFCPDIDKGYADSMKKMQFKPEFIKSETKRKPSIEMLNEALEQLNKNLKDFDRILVFGNSKDDANLAKNLNAAYIGINYKKFESLRKQFDYILNGW